MKITLRRKENVEEVTLTEFCEMYNLDKNEVESYAEEIGGNWIDAILWKFKPDFFINILGDLVDPEE